MTGVDDPRAAKRAALLAAVETVRDTLLANAAEREAKLPEELGGAGLRDLNAAAQHAVVSDASHENHARFLLGFPDADPLA